MKGDFSRSTFRRVKHYRKVKLQQGRVHVDADWNEQVDIQAYYDQMSLQDIIGSSGGPAETAGFSITPAGKGYQVGAGRYYVNGLAVENEKEDIETPRVQAGRYLAYLKVWEQGITALDDPDIRESALGGPDTAVRVQVAWKVLLQRLGSSDIDEEWNKIVTSPSNYSDGTLWARAKPQDEITDACMLPPGAGYRRLQNQFYRIEVHDTGKDGNGATFKWSRDNASLAANVTEISGSQINVSNIGRDRYESGFKEDQWIEITNDDRVLENRPGSLAKITKVDRGANTIVFDAATVIGDAITAANYPKGSHPKITKWDSAGRIPVPAFDGADDKGYVAIEDGLEVKFGSGNYRTGDYWWVPARTAKGDIEWPRDGSSNPEALPPEGTVHHYCRLAVLEFGQDLSLDKVTDLRRFFPAITTLTTMQYVGGDGQRGTPRAFLPSPLMVGVSRGGTPLGGVAVRFEVKAGKGEVFTERKAGRAGDPDKRQASVKVFTDNAGIARCHWQLDNVNDSQWVEAIMLDVTDDAVHLPVVFNAAMEHGAPPTGLRVTSGLIKDKVATETYKIAGPFYHDVDAVVESNAPPSILLGETNVDIDDANITETVRQMEDLTLMSILNKQYGTPTRDSEDSSALAARLGLDDYLDKDDDTPQVPVFFKPVSVDAEKFYVFMANYNKSPSQITWASWVALAGATVKQMAPAMNKDGRLEVFAIDTAEQPVRISQTVENGNWGEWVKMPSQALRQIAVAANADGTLHVFGTDPNGKVVHIWQDKNGNWGTAWSVFESDAKIQKITVANNADGRLEVFAIDDKGLPGHMWQTAGTDDMLTWSKWFPMHGIKAKDLTVGMNKDGRLEVFAVGHRYAVVDTNMVAIQYSEDLFKISSLVRNRGKSFVMRRATDSFAGATVKKTAEVAMTRELKAALYENAFKSVEAAQPKVPVTQPTTEPVDMVFHAWQASPNGEWASWSQLGSQQATNVAVANNADGRLEVFIIGGADEALYHIWQTAPNNGWSGWASLGGKVKDIAVANNADGRIEVFAVTPRSRLILSTGLLLDTKLIADRLNTESLKTLADARRAATVFTELSKANIIGKTDVSMAVKAEDVYKFRELAIIKNRGKDVTVGYALYHIWQTAPNNGWSAWSSLGGEPNDIAVAANANGRLTAFAIGEGGSAINATTQMRIETEVNLRWWAIPAVDVHTREKRGPSDEKPSDDDKDVREKANEERKAAEAKAAAEKAAAEKAAAEKKALEDKAAAERTAAARVAAEKAAAEKAAAEKAAAEKAAVAERAAAARASAARASAAEKAAAEKAAAAAREAARRAAAEKAAAERAAAERLAAERVAEAARLAASRAAAEKAAAERAAAEKAAAERAASLARAAAERAAAERKAAEEKAAAERAEAIARAAAEKAAAAERAATGTTVDSSRVVPAERFAPAFRPEFRAVAVNPNASRCAEIDKEVTSLQTQLRNPSLPIAARQAIGAKLQALKAEKTKLNCPP